MYNARMLTSIKTYSLDGLTSLVKELGQPSFRAKQIYQWLYNKGASSFDEMSNLPAALREDLAKTYEIDAPKLVSKQVSRDGTRKYLVSFASGLMAETVGIPSHDGGRLTVCFSTQAGCSMGCAFCATGQEGFSGNLLVGNIVDQILLVQKDFGIRVTNVVGMGQGEPFLNYDNVLAALRIINDSTALGIGARRISVSTCGIIPGIERFSTEPEQFTLAISLHTALQEKRDRLMPGVAKMSLKQLRGALFDYVRATNRRVTLEYIMISGINDGDEDLLALTDFCEGLLCHINLIPVNSVSGSSYQPSASQTIKHWVQALENAGTETTLRQSRGADIDGACGQLKNAL